MKKRELFLLLLIVCPLFIYAQIGINTTTPNTFADFDIKNRVLGTDTIPKGILIPRMTETQRNQIDVTTNSKDADGLMIYNIDENCYNYYNHSENEWKSICGALGKAVFDPINCDSIRIKGNYIEGKETNASNYLEIDVVLSKPGTYSISGTTGNGYSFTAIGVVMEKGPFKIRVPAQGTPKVAGSDVLTIKGLPFTGGSDCMQEIEVVPPIAIYSINCSSTTINGVYQKGKPLNPANTISLRVNVSQMGSYDISTEETNGIKFSAKGYFNTIGSQEVILTGKGGKEGPTVNTDFLISIITNTPIGNSTCEVTIPIVLPPMTFSVIGTSTAYSWANSSRQKSLTGGTSFGPNGIVKIESLKQLWVGGVSAAVTQLNGNGSQPDIILYFAQGAAPTATLTDALKNYINKGGCVIYGSNDNGEAAVNTLLQGVFGISTAEGQITDGDDDVYPIANISDDPIINGPFGNTAGRYWGEDNASNGSVVLSMLPPNSIQIASANSKKKTGVNPEYSIVWYNNAKNFVFFGDSVGASSTDATSTSYPSYYDANGKPRTKSYGPTGNKQFAYDASLELNAVAWALKKAATSGINPH